MAKRCQVGTCSHCVCVCVCCDTPEHRPRSFTRQGWQGESSTCSICLIIMICIFPRDIILVSCGIVYIALYAKSQSFRAWSRMPSSDTIYYTT